MKSKNGKRKILPKRMTITVSLVLAALLAAACGAPAEVTTAPAEAVEVEQESLPPLEEELQPQTGQPRQTDFIFPGAQYMGKRAFSQADSEFFVTSASFQEVGSFYDGMLPDAPSRHYSEEDGYAYIQTELMRILMEGDEITSDDIAVLGRLLNIHIAADKDVGAVKATANQEILEQLPENQTIIILTYTIMY